MSSNWRYALRSLENENFRRYLIGQGISNAGMWIQIVAELWLIAELTDSALLLALHNILRLGPILLFGAFAGLIGDRSDRRRLLLVTQSTHTVATTALAVTAWLTTPSLVMIYFIVLTQGLVNAVDNPVRRSFLRDLTGDDDDIANAVSLHSTVATTARAAGPAIAGILITTLGVKWCFTFNAVSYLAVLASLVLVDRSALRPRPLAPRGPGQLRSGFRYAWSNHAIRTSLVLTFVISLFAWQWNVILPVYARDEFAGNATLFGALVSVLSVGSVIGAVMTARKRRLGGRHLRWAGLFVTIGLAVSAWAPVVAIAVVGLAILGGAASSFAIGGQSRIQLAVEDAMTTRIMALYSVVFTGAKPIGSLLAGVVIDGFGPRWAFAIAGMATATATATYSLSRITQHRRETAAE